MSTKSNLEELAKKQAIHDIKKSLKEEKKVFLLFRKELNPIMDKIVENYSNKVSK